MQYSIRPPAGEFKMKNIWLKSGAGLSLPSFKRPVRLRARTPPFHGGDTGSNPVRATKNRYSTARYETESRPD